MTNEERERMKWLSERLMKERDHKKFNELVKEMVALLERKGSRLEHSAKPKSN
jgi:hypothetical protein